MRLDQYLVNIKIMRSRAQAKDFIQRGKVKVNGHLVTKASYFCNLDTKIQIIDDANIQWVARSGQKLYGALKRLNLDLTGKTCLDVGQSKGGFTQAMLKKNAGVVVGVDVGKNQVDKGIRDLANVYCYESFDARELLKLKGQWSIDFFAVDVSFISVLKIFQGLKDLVCRDFPIKGFLLIKPQFEVGEKKVKKGGLVHLPLIHLECEKKVLAGLVSMGAIILDYFPSSLRGRDGNEEFICYISI